MNEETFEEYVAKVKQFPIIKYAEMCGYSVVHKGNKYYSLKEHDSVIIDPEKNSFFRNSNGVGGSIIDFAIEFKGKSQAQAIKDLIELTAKVNISELQTPHISNNKAKKIEVNNFTLPPKDDNMRCVYAYLTKSRGISSDIVNEFRTNKQLYQDKNKNCVFVSYNKENKAEFATKRGTNTYKRYLGDVPGSNYDNCFFVDNNSETMLVTESVIDAMSVMSIIHENGGNYKEYSYLALAGVQKFSAVKNQYLQHKNIKHIIIATDNDTAGKLCVENIKNELKEFDVVCKEHLPTIGKDWNEVLTTFYRNKEHSIKKEKTIEEDNSLDDEYDLTM